MTEKRSKKISGDITPTAKALIDAYCIEKDLSKGKLLERMIRKFLGDEANPTIANIATVEKPLGVNSVKVNVKQQSKRFIPPKFFDVDEYMRERMCTDPITQAEKFCDYYESNGWKVGKNKMKCWKAAVRNWLKNNKPAQSKVLAGNLEGKW